MDSFQKTSLFLLASLAGGFWISVLRYYGAYTYLKAPPIHNNIKPSRPSTITDDDLVESHNRNIKSRNTSSIDDLVELHKMNIKFRHTSRSSLSFCNDRTNHESKGILGIRDHHPINMYFTTISD